MLQAGRPDSPAAPPAIEREPAIDARNAVAAQIPPTPSDGGINHGSSDSARRPSAVIPSSTTLVIAGHGATCHRLRQMQSDVVPRRNAFAKYFWYSWPAYTSTLLIRRCVGTNSPTRSLGLRG